jgi:hypothetical protein
MIGEGASREGDSPTPARRPRPAQPRTRDLRSAMDSALTSLRDDAAAEPGPAAPAPARVPSRTKRTPAQSAVEAGIARAIGEVEASMRPEPAAVIHLPLPPRDPDLETRDHAPAIEAWVAPLVEEVARMRRELAELRTTESRDDRAPTRELVKLLAGIFLCFVLVATALAVVLKG